MNLRRSNHRFDPRKAFFQEQEDVFLKSVAESGEWRDVFACTSGRVFRNAGMKKERREAMTEVLRIALERCGDYSKTCFAAIYTERKGIVAYASPKRVREEFSKDSMQTRCWNQNDPMRRMCGI